MKSQFVLLKGLDEGFFLSFGEAFLVDRALSSVTIQLALISVVMRTYCLVIPV